MNQICNRHHVEEDRKVSLTTLSFKGQAMYWWTSLMKDPYFNLRYWNELKNALNKCHVPSYYERELLYQLQKIRQRDLTLEEYRHKNELLIFRASVKGMPEVTIVIFNSGINLEI